MEIRIQKLVDSNYPFDPIRNIFFENYDCIKDKYNIVYGIKWYDGETYKDYTNIVIDLEEPNLLNNKNCDIIKKFDKKLTLCPYSAAFNNKLTGINNSIQIFFPIDIEYIIKNIGYPTFDKKINVLYIGHIVSNLLKEFNRLSESISVPTYLDKIIELYNTKISICHNVLFYENDIGLYNNLINLIPELTDDKYEVPQLKSRIFESGFSKCIPLVYYHKSKIVETYFTPDVDFIYFHNINELESLINKILENYDDYKYIAENIYNKCMEKYKLSDFINTYF